MKHLFEDVRRSFLSNVDPILMIILVCEEKLPGCSHFYNLYAQELAFVPPNLKKY